MILYLLITPATKINDDEKELDKGRPVHSEEVTRLGEAQAELNSHGYLASGEADQGKVASD